MTTHRNGRNGQPIGPIVQPLAAELREAKGRLYHVARALCEVGQPPLELLPDAEKLDLALAGAIIEVERALATLDRVEAAS